MEENNSGGRQADKKKAHSSAENPARDGHTGEPATPNTARAYWNANLRMLGGLLAIWFIVSFGAGILFVEPLNEFSFLGMPLGFWFAQQGSIYIFVVLIFVYAASIHRIEKKFGVDDD